MNRKVEAIQNFDNGFNCSQAVLSVFCEELGLSKEVALKISTGFGGGMRRGEVCGAVTGAIMAIGLKNGHFIEGDTDSKAKAYEITKQFELKFEELNGSIICKQLLGYDITIENELKMIKEKTLFDMICPKMIEDSINILEDLLLDKE
ncbi:MAG: hypothetical protein CVU84_08135 [Firmicutes bacterium HGW-Firmicutes-1]|jgi:C_GCAxxG_C_C family probable redox protein|nr:MAG: hypothetical protein CVU84_08135 [Firmicutes bacterium HGW-Firmicutes-1]